MAAQELLDARCAAGDADQEIGCAVVALSGHEIQEFANRIGVMPLARDGCGHWAVAGCEIGDGGDDRFREIDLAVIGRAEDRDRDRQLEHALHRERLRRIEISGFAALDLASGDAHGAA